MDNNILSDLHKIYSFTLELEEKIKSMSGYEETKDLLQKDIHDLSDKITFPENIKYLLITLVKSIILYFLPTVAIIAAFFSLLGYSSLPNSYSPAYTIVINIILGLIVTIIFYLINRKRITKKIENLEYMISKQDESINECSSQLQILLSSSDALLTKSTIPPDYRKSHIIEKFIYFFRNGHVDTMKEAVHEYDNYRHNKKMQHAAEESASAAAETARNSAKVAKTAEEIHFWTIYNAFVNSK